ALIDGRLPAISNPMIPTRSARTRNANPRVAWRKSWSSRYCFLRLESGIALDTVERSERPRESPSIVLATVLILDASLARHRSRLPDRLARLVLDLALPGRLDELNDFVWHWYVVEIEGHLIPALVRPAEELQDFLRLFAIRLRLVHQDEG